MKKQQTEQERIEVAMQEEWERGAITVQCVHCDSDLTAEPDAKESWCYECQKDAKVRNPLVDNGMI